MTSAAEDLKAVDVDEDRAVALLNERYAVCIVGGRPAIIVEDGDSFDIWTVLAFIRFLADRKVLRGDKAVPLSKVFLEHADTRRCRGIVFAPEGAPPDLYNIWKGFSFEPVPGNWGRFREHLFNNVCGGDEDLFAWVVGWFADIIQHPGEKIGTALDICGPAGVGKTIVGRIFGRLFRHHYLMVADPHQVTGHFNAHMANLLLLHADEAFFAGDKASAGALKSLITSDSVAVEF